MKKPVTKTSPFGRGLPDPKNHRDHGLGATRGPAKADPPQDPRALSVGSKVGGWPYPDHPGLE